MTIKDLNELLYEKYKNGSWQIRIRFTTRSSVTIFNNNIFGTHSGYRILLHHIAQIISTQKDEDDFNYSLPGNLYADVLSIPEIRLSTFMTTSRVESDVNFYVNLDLQIVSVFLRDSTAPEYSASFDKFYEDCFGFKKDFLNNSDPIGSDEVKL